MIISFLSVDHSEEGLWWFRKALQHTAGVANERESLKGIDILEDMFIHSGGLDEKILQ